MDKKHTLGIKLPHTSKCCVGIQLTIGRKRINAVGLYKLDKDGRRIDDLEELDLEFVVYELEVRDMDDIAFLMDEENFNKFCELWREYHNAN